MPSVPAVAMCAGFAWWSVSGVVWFLRFRGLERWVRRERPEVWRRILPWGASRTSDLDSYGLSDRAGVLVTLQSWIHGYGLTDSLRGDADFMRQLRRVRFAGYATAPGLIAYAVGFWALFD